MKEGCNAVKNIDIRIAISDNDLRHKDVAREIGVSPEWFSRLLKNDLSPENWIRISNAIERMKEKR